MITMWSAAPVLGSSAALKLRRVFLVLLNRTDKGRPELVPLPVCSSRKETEQLTQSEEHIEEIYESENNFREDGAV